MKRTIGCLALAALVCSVATANEPTVAEVTHWQFQAIDEYGVGTYDAIGKVTVRGILLNNPEEMLNPTPSPVGMGGQWQIFIQGETDPNGLPDHAGTAVWLGQNYSQRGRVDYTDEEFVDELHRVNRDPETGDVFQAGDRVEVTGFYMFFGGKMNINEHHRKESDFNFTVKLLKPAVGLPEAAVLTLPELKHIDVENIDTFIFDPNRLSGPEYYQARRVRIDNVEIIDPEKWQPNGLVTVMDENGLTFPIKLGIGHGFSRYPCPEGPIDVIGIMNQESGSGLHGMTGYHIWVVNYDGNGRVLADRGRPRGNLPGDVNNDFKVDLQDLAELAENWLTERVGL